MNKQRERYERGNEFQEEMRYSWSKIEHCWRMRVKDGGGGTRPADELILLHEMNILAEHKRTQGDRFELSFLRQDQRQGLLEFEGAVTRNLGIVFVSFQDLDIEPELDECYAFRLITALLYMRKMKRQYITLDEFREGTVQNVWLPRMDEGYYDLRGLLRCYKSL